MPVPRIPSLPLRSECMNLCDKYEKIFSRTADDSELYQLNHRELTPVKGTEDTYQVSASLAELVSKGLDYSVLSEGAFDIAIEPLTSLWDFTAENPKVPKDSLIQAALPKCNYHNISVDTDKNEITLKFIKTRQINYQQFKESFVPNLSIIDVMMFNSRERVKEYLYQYDLVEEDI